MKRIILLLLFLLFFYSVSKAGEIDVVKEKKEEPKKGVLREIGCYGGYAKGFLKEKGSYNVAQMGFRFGFDMNPLLAKIYLKPPIGELDFVIEPFINTIIKPRSNAEMGVALVFKYMLPVTKKFTLYAEASAGPMYFTQHTLEQSTQFNFIDQGGGGFYFYVNDNVALNMGYRRRHISNCSIDHPNSGINSDSYLMGVSYLK